MNTYIQIYIQTYKHVYMPTHIHILLNISRQCVWGPSQIHIKTKKARWLIVYIKLRGRSHNSLSWPKLVRAVGMVPTKQLLSKSLSQWTTKQVCIFFSFKVWIPSYLSTSIFFLVKSKKGLLYFKSWRALSIYSVSIWKPRFECMLGYF